MGPPHKVYVPPHPSPPITALSPCTCPSLYHQGLGKTLYLIILLTYLLQTVIYFTPLIVIVQPVNTTGNKDQLIYVFPLLLWYDVHFNFNFNQYGEQKDTSQ